MTDKGFSDIVREELWALFSWPKKLSMRDCAKATGVSVPTISRFVNGSVIMSDKLDALAKWAGVGWTRG